MNRFKSFLLVIFLISMGSSLDTITAQDKTKEEKEREIKIQYTIEQQKRAMTEQKKEQERALQEFKEQQEQLQESLDDIEVHVDMADDPDKFLRIYRRGRDGERSFRIDEPFIFPPGMDSFYGRPFGDSERTTWEFSKTVKENTFSRDYSFDVEKTAKTVVMAIMGDCKNGEIRIKIVMPNGKNYSDIVIDEFGNLNWRKSFSISETENQDKTGDWKFKITSTKATGFFKISLQTY